MRLKFSQFRNDESNVVQILVAHIFEKYCHIEKNRSQISSAVSCKMKGHKMSENDYNSDQRHNWIIRDDLCESSFKMNVRLGSSRLRFLIRFLAIISFAANVILIMLQQHETDNPVNRLLTVDLADLSVTSGGAMAVQRNIEKNPMPKINNNITKQAFAFSIKSTNRILAEEKRETRKKRQAYRKARRKFVEPKPILSKSNLTACLLIKDDNEILSEWIAYHYHALKMRFLIVAIDPQSSQSPGPILAKWKLLTDLEILEWDDSMYMPKYFLQNGHAPLKYLQKYGRNMDLEG
jgi:hypothetical protein